MENETNLLNGLNGENPETAEASGISGVSELAENPETAGLNSKKGMFARLRSLIAGKNDSEAEPQKPKPAKQKKQTVGSSVRTFLETSSEDMLKFNRFLGAIEIQLDKVEGQNVHLLHQLSTLEKNNALLLEQVQALTKNNNQLTEQYNNMKRREKIAKIMAIISATIGIGLGIYNVIRLILS